MVQTFLVNKLGYTFLAEAICANPLPRTRWGIRVLSKPEFPVDTEVGAFGLLNIPKLQCEISMPVVPKKYNVLFRSESQITCLHSSNSHI